MYVLRLHSLDDMRKKKQGREKPWYKYYDNQDFESNIEWKLTSPISFFIGLEKGRDTHTQSDRERVKFSILLLESKLVVSRFA